MLPAGKGGLDVVLLRVPMATAAAALLNPNMDALLPAILKDPETSIVTRASVEENKDWAGRFEETKLFNYIPLCHASQYWRGEQQQREAGEEVTEHVDADEIEHEPIGTVMDVRMCRHGDDFEMKVDFSWTPEPLTRPFPVWPLKKPGLDFLPMFKPWEFSGSFALKSRAISLLAANPEAADGVGKGVHSGSMLMAFGRARRVVAEPTDPTEDDETTTAHPSQLRSWTLEVPLAVGEKLLRNNISQTSDSALLKTMMGHRESTLISSAALAFTEWEVRRRLPPPSIFGDLDPAAHFQVVPKKAASPFDPPIPDQSTSLFLPNPFVTEITSLLERCSLRSGLQFEYPLGFEPPGTKEFRVICNEHGRANLEHSMKFDMASSDGNLGFSWEASFPATPIRWEKWHGSTLGAKDEPVGVETPICGTDTWSGVLNLSPGVTRLASARQINGRVRMTFIEWLRGSGEVRDEPIPILNSNATGYETIRVLETPLEPWLERLRQPQEAGLMSELIAALDRGEAKLIQLSTQSLSFEKGKFQTGVGYLFQEAYLNTSLQGDHLYFNPRFVSPRTTGIELERTMMHNDSEVEGVSGNCTVTELLGRQHYALWIPRSPLHTRETSGIDCAVLGRTTLVTSVMGADGKDRLAGACVLPASKFREAPAIRWFLSRLTTTTKSATPKIANPAWVEFTVLAADASGKDGAAEPVRANPVGRLLAQGMVLMSDIASIHTGLDWTSPEPREGVDSEGITPKVIPNGTVYSNQTDLVTSACGLDASLTGNQWKVTYRPDPEFAVDTLDSFEEGPVTPEIAKKRPIPISCERALYEKPSTANGTLPAPGKQISVSLGAGRVLIVRRLVP